MRQYLLFLLPTALSATAVADAPNPHLDARRAEFRSALEQAERGPPLDAATRRALLDHPLYPYLEYAELRRDLAHARAADVRALLERHARQPFARPLRAAWLAELAKRKDWATFRTFATDTDDIALRCHGLTAALAAGKRDESTWQAIATIWLHGHSLPDACDAPFAALQSAGQLTDALRWQRIVLAAEAGNASLMRYLARGLPTSQRPLADRYAGYIDAPTVDAANWPRDDRSRQIAAFGVMRLARRDRDAAERVLAALARLGLGEAQRGRALHQIALWSAASYEPESVRRFAAVPAAAWDAQLHEWRAREALTRSDFAAALAAIGAMPEPRRSDSRWRYLAARAQELSGDIDAARAGFATLAVEPTYFGFLAADRIGAPYALCPIEPPRDAPTRDALLGHAGIQRAFELHRLDRPAWALLEWNAAVPGLSDNERRLAVALALEIGWTDRAVFALASGDDQRVYSLRFPLDHDKHLLREAGRHALDPSWVAALIRAESGWQPRARSHADARGLMQLLPSTGKQVSRRLGQRWKGPASLFDPRTSITLGTAHLAELRERYDSGLHVVTAAYNAGPTPVGRWLAERPQLPPDLWIETIPYHETRDYVARILAFAVIYDWRLGHAPVSVTARMQGAKEAVARRGFVCPLAGTNSVAQD